MTPLNIWRDFLQFEDSIPDILHEDSFSYTLNLALIDYKEEKKDDDFLEKYKKGDEEKIKKLDYKKGGRIDREIDFKNTNKEDFDVEGIENFIKSKK